MTEKRIHQIFVVSLLLKRADALLECLLGGALFVIGTPTIVALVNALTQEELVEDAHDLVATRLRTVAQHLSISSQHFYGVYLLSHGVIKIALVAGLLKEKLWMYPVSLIVIFLFIVYQMYRYSYAHGAGLILLSGFDVVVMVLIWHEYRLLRRRLH